MVMRAALLGLLAAILALSTISFAHQASVSAPLLLHGRAPLTQVGSGELRVGAARVELHVPPRGPIAGYPAWRRDDGHGEPLFVRALAIEQGPLSALLVSLPLLMVSGPLEEAIVQRASISPASCALIAATHTHSGPGGTWDDLLVEIGGNGLYSRERADAVVQAAVDAIAQARASLKPARVAGASDRWADGPAVARSGELDPSLGVARFVDADGRPIASVVIYGMHATVIPRSVHHLSGDWPEAAAQQLERSSGAPALVLQGAGGNATFSREGIAADPQRAVEQIGARVATAAARELSGAPLAETTQPLSCGTKIVVLPEPRAALSVAWPLRRAAGNLLRIFAERAAVASSLTLPGLALRGIPGEPTGALAHAGRGPDNRAEIFVGLADGYVGYVESAEHWTLAEGESARTWYGPALAAALGLESAAPREMGK